ncbi:DUF4843 domain-containing protein [Polaribacter cellanae]|uniref:DUF4843 domain-containing protein n=1 Tax=Polaribacter cellanae TaxID=2818493 RepID=A0A975H5V1_9FLAO|nr:DUF4843 domain-containing protein [Polaribacter cellanae]QTE21328.1 DUF4843 domain-containing protein [Polaribacter cellanae]
MKKYIKTIIATCLVGLTFFACENEDIATFSGKNVIYFQWAIDGKDFAANKIDSTSITFAYKLPSKVSDSLIKVPIKVQGFISDKDRTVKINILKTSTAKKGVHFNIADNIIVPANEIIGYIPVTLNRTADMKLKPFSLKLQLLENKNFKTNLKGSKKSSNANRLLNYTEFELTFSDILTEPDKWFILKSWIGDFSTKKLYLFAEVNKIPVPNYNKFPDFGNFLGQLAVMKAYLAAQKNAGTPILEEDGSEMTLGPYA